MHKKMTVIILSLMLFFWGCAGSPAPASREDEAVAAADAAVAAMNRGGSPAVPSSSTGNSTAAPRQTADNGEPAWASGDPYAVYNRNAYIAAVGYGQDRKKAEQNALVELTAYFSRSMEAEFRDMNSFSQAVSNGAIQVSENTSIQEAIVTSTRMDALVGAEIGDVWDNGKGSVYAVALMDKAKIVPIYAGMIRSNLQVIDKFTAMSNAEKNTLDGYTRYQRAAIIANANQAYAKVLSLAGNNTDINTASLKKGEDYRLEAANIAKNIPVTVVVNNDRSARIRDAFAQALSALGFRSGGNNARYVLNATLTLAQADIPNQPYKFVRYVVEANLTDTAENHILLPFNVNGREGRNTVSEAETIAVSAAEKKIRDSYGETLSAWLSSLLPQN
jgi:hypothetical protein